MEELHFQADGFGEAGLFCIAGPKRFKLRMALELAGCRNVDEVTASRRNFAGVSGTEFVCGFEGGVESEHGLPREARLSALRGAKSAPGDFSVRVGAGLAEIVAEFEPKIWPIDKIGRVAEDSGHDRASELVARMKESEESRGISVNERHNFVFCDLLKSDWDVWGRGFYAPPILRA